MNEGTQVRCQRCGKPCRGSQSDKPDARMLKKAMKGECLTCATVTFLQRLINMNSEGSFPDMPNALNYEHVQKQFEAVMRSGKAEASFEEIDWMAVIAHWDVGEKSKGGLF